MLSCIIRQVSIPLYWLDNFKYFLKDSITIGGDEAKLLIENKYLGKLPVDIREDHQNEVAIIRKASSIRKASNSYDTHKDGYDDTFRELETRLMMYRIPFTYVTYLEGSLEELRRTTAYYKDSEYRVNRYKCYSGGLIDLGLMVTAKTSIKIDIAFQMEKDIVSKFNDRFPWNGDTKEIANTAIARQLLDM